MNELPYTSTRKGERKNGEMRERGRKKRKRGRRRKGGIRKCLEYVDLDGPGNKGDNVRWI